MFTVYLDDSGTSPSQRVAIATGLIVPAKRNVAFESEWETLKRKEGFSSFHTSEFVARQPKSEFADWDDLKQTRVFHRVREITRKYGTIAFSFAVNKQDYDEAIPEEWRNHFGKHHYTWAIRHVMKFLDQWRLGLVPEPLEYVFDWMGKSTDPRRREITTVMEQAEDIGTEAGRIGDYAKYSFGHRKDIAGLQCVDMVGWACYQTALQQFAGKPYHPFAATAFSEFERHDSGPRWLHAITVTKPNLLQWLAVEKQNPKSIELFRKWQALKSAKRK